jgi:hypothetical protein
MPVQDILAQASDILSKTQGEGALTSLGKGITQGIAIADSFERSRQNRRILEQKQQELEMQYAEKGIGMLEKMGSPKISPKAKKPLGRFYQAFAKSSNARAGKKLLPELDDATLGLLQTDEGIKFREVVKNAMDQKYGGAPSSADPKAWGAYNADMMAEYEKLQLDPDDALKRTMEENKPLMTMAGQVGQSTGFVGPQLVSARKDYLDLEKRGVDFTPEERKLARTTNDPMVLADILANKAPAIMTMGIQDEKNKLAKEKGGKATERELNILADPNISKGQKDLVDRAIQERAVQEFDLEQRAKNMGLADTQTKFMQSIQKDVRSYMDDSFIANSTMDAVKIAKTKLGPKGLDPFITNLLVNKLNENVEAKLSVIRESDSKRWSGIETKSLDTLLEQGKRFVLTGGGATLPFAKKMISTLELVAQTKIKDKAARSKLFASSLSSSPMFKSLPKEAREDLISGLPPELGLSPKMPSPTPSASPTNAPIKTKAESAKDYGVALKKLEAMVGAMSVPEAKKKEIFEQERVKLFNAIMGGK